MHLALPPWELTTPTYTMELRDAWQQAVSLTSFNPVFS
jgi:hypothetical protein